MKAENIENIMKDKRMVTIFKGNGLPIAAVKQDRNAKCKCGSGLKAKKCCGAETKYYDRNKKN